uniref:Putative secreted protein n=1 Tax=Xenopsylla cheopis TaxID=163159 RepID=A0A6M2DUI5_XENCH
MVITMIEVAVLVAISVAKLVVVQGETNACAVPLDGNSQLESVDPNVLLVSTEAHITANDVIIVVVIVKMKDHYHVRAVHQGTC